MWRDFAFATTLALFVTLVLATAIFIFSRSDPDKFGTGVITTLVVAGLMIWLVALWFLVSTGTRLPALP